MTNPTSPLALLKAEAARRAADRVLPEVFAHEIRLHGRRHGTHCDCKQCRIRPAFVAAKIRLKHTARDHDWWMKRRWQRGVRSSTDDAGWGSGEPVVLPAIEAEYREAVVRFNQIRVEMDAT